MCLCKSQDHRTHSVLLTRKKEEKPSSHAAIRVDLTRLACQPVIVFFVWIHLFAFERANGQPGCLSKDASVISFGHDCFCSALLADWVHWPRNGAKGINNQNGASARAHNASRINFHLKFKRTYSRANSTAIMWMLIINLRPATCIALSMQNM